MKTGWQPIFWTGALILLLLSACGRQGGSSSPLPPAAPQVVQVAQAGLRPIERTVVAVGTLAARETVTVSAQVAGQIEQSAVDLGDTVSTDQELALIDTTAYEAIVRQNAANLARATAAAASAEQDLQRVQNLQKAGIASASDLDTAVAEAGQRRADVEATGAALAIAELNLQRSRVRAPFAGAVAQRLASAGDYVSVGTPIFRLVQTDPLRLRLEVPERDAPAVHVGQMVRLTVEGETNVHSGRLVRLAPAIRESDRMMVVEADVPNPGYLRAGSFARARIVINLADPALVIPPEALLTFAGIEKVVTIQNGKAVERTVATGQRGEDWVEIVAGLSPGDAVVKAPVGLRTGQPLIVDAEAR
jgi:RND family efflux transporter MFP subunit